MKRPNKGFCGMTFYALVLICILVFFCASFASASAQEASVKLPILMYHDVTENCTPDEYTVLTSQLEADLYALRADGWETVTLTDVIQYVYADGFLPEKPVLLVFDDGYQSILTHVIPLLEKYDAHAVVSVIGARAQALEDGCDTTGNYMDWAALHAAALSGRLELQSHSAQLHVYRTRKGAGMLPDESAEAYAEVLLNDIRTMNEWTQAAGLSLLPSFAYPYGYVEPLADMLLQQQGYLATMTSEPHINMLSRDPQCLFRLGRFNRSGLIDTQEVLEWLECA